jgi:hypothetical protein
MGMDDRSLETLQLRVDDEHLKYSIYLLRYREPEIRYPEAWRILTTEADRRRGGAGAAPAPVPTPRSVFDALPTVVQDLLTEG